LTPAGEKILFRIDWALYSSYSSQHMRIDHGGAYIFVSQKFLDSPDVISLFKEMCCKTMAESVAASGFLDFCLSDRGFYCSLE